MPEKRKSRGNLTPARRRELIRAYVGLLKEHDDLMAKERQVGQDAPPVKPSRKSHSGNRPGPTAIAAEKFGVDRRTIMRAVAEAKSEPAKPPEPPSQAPALQAAFIAAAERYRDAEQ